MALGPDYSEDILDDLEGIIDEKLVAAMATDDEPAITITDFRLTPDRFKILKQRYINAGWAEITKDDVVITFYRKAQFHSNSYFPPDK
jgi:hypothetical protein